MRDFTIFMTRMENHFMRYADYFTTDERKVSEGVSELSDKLLLKWQQHNRDIGAGNATWKDFYEYFLALINDPKALLRDAAQNFTDARQKPDQSVRDFAAYLSQ